MNAQYHVRQDFIAQIVPTGVRVVFDESSTHAFGEFIAAQDFIGDGCQLVEYTPTDFNDLSPYNARRMTEEISQEVQS